MQGGDVVDESGECGGYGCVREQEGVGAKGEDGGILPGLKRGGEEEEVKWLPVVEGLVAVGGGGEEGGEEAEGEEEREEEEEGGEAEGAERGVAVGGGERWGRGGGGRRWSGSATSSHVGLARRGSRLRG